MRIFLTGYMYSGKTTIGKKVARKLELPFYDLDDYFEIKYKISVTQFFEKYSEELFRKLETETLAELIRQEDNVLISTGGGTACFNHNMELMNASGLTVYVEMSPKSVFARMQASKRKGLCCCRSRRIKWKLLLRNTLRKGENITASPG
ncbi:MAG: shikimate kinase [Bacteroidota bacterium]|nr:shikimate kinase [Bacteroidota bacterium]